MISRNVTVTVSDESSVSDSKVILYRGDGNIIFNFDIQDGRYKYSTQSILETMGSPLSANATMLAPNGENVFQTPVLPVQENNIVQIAVNKDMIDDLTEIGTYKFQIHLYSDTKDRITLPPLDFEVSDTIGEAPMPNFNDGIVGFTKVGESYVAEGPVVTLKYTKNTWSIGDLITDKKLNNMESGIEANALNIEVNKSKIEEHGTAIQDIQTTIGELSGADTAILESIATNANNIAENTTNIQNNTEAIGANAQAIESNTNSIEAHTTSIEANTQAINGATTEITELKKSVNTNKSTILETKGEVEGARTGANGQVYGTLKERLDEEFEAIHQQIVDPYLDFEGERVTVEHSLEGQTKDMVVDGRTIQNVVPLDFVPPSNLDSNTRFKPMILKNKQYTIIVEFNNQNTEQAEVSLTVDIIWGGVAYFYINSGNSIHKKLISIDTDDKVNYSWFFEIKKGTSSLISYKNIMILEGDWTNKEVPPYFEGIQSVGDKSKNLFNKDNITLSQKTLLIDCKAGKSYSFSYDYAGDYEGDVRVQLATTTEIQTTTGELSNVAEVKMVDSTIGRNTTTIKSTIDGYLYLRFVQTAFIGHISNIQLEEGTVATPYEHYYEGHKISILSRGKNLFNLKSFTSNNNTTIEYIENGYILTGNGDWKSLSYKFKLEPNKKYYFKFNREWISGDKGTSLVIKDNGENIVDDNQADGSYGRLEYNFTPKTENVSIIIFSSRANASKTKVTDLILSGSNSMYEPYIEDKKEILLKTNDGSPYLVGLCGLPNGIKDTIEQREDGVYFIRRITSKIFNGSDTDGIWSTVVGNKELPEFNTTMPQDMKYARFCSLICDKLPTPTNQDMWVNNDVGCSVGADTKVWVKIQDKTINSIDKFKEFLSNSPITIYYELAEPEMVKLDIDNINLKTYKDITYIQAETFISPIFSFKAPIDTLATINALRLSKDNLISENAKLKEELQVTNEELEQLTTEQDLFKLDVDERLLNLELGGTIDVR